MPTSQHPSAEQRLARPVGPVDVVIDTDTYNEIDDQYALAYLIAHEETLRLQAVYAAPFDNARVSGPDEGMRRSYDEIIHILTLLGRNDLHTRVYPGAQTYLPDETRPAESAAARDLAQRAMAYTPEKPLYVIAIAAITNVASALLLNPEIADRIVVIWLGGHAFDWPRNNEFNLRQDVAGARVLFDSGVPMVLLPCMGVVSAFSTTRMELEYWLKGKNALCDYLVEATLGEAGESKRGRFWSKPIWDVAAVAWLVDSRFMEDRLEYSPIPEYDDRWAFSKNRPMLRYVYHIHRDRLIEDLFTRLAAFQ